MAEQFEYLKEKYHVILVHNPDYLTRNNNASIYVAKDYLKNSYICSSDNYFLTNPFVGEVDDSFIQQYMLTEKPKNGASQKKKG